MHPAMVGQPLSFHSDPTKYGYILYQGTVCERLGPWGSVYHDEVRHTSVLNFECPCLTFHPRHTTPKMLSRVNPRNYLLKPHAVNLLTAARTSSTTLMPISFTVSHSTPLPPTAPIPSHPAVCSLPQISSKATTESRTWVSERTLEASWPLRSFPNSRWWL